MFTKKKNILVIEDEPDLAFAVREILENKGYVVRVGESAERGLEMINETVPDLLLLDTILPGMSGIELLQQLESIRSKTPFPVIMLSNIDNPDDLKKAREYDIAEYLVKSDWRLDDVIEKIKKIL